MDVVNKGDPDVFQKRSGAARLIDGNGRLLLIQPSEPKFDAAGSTPSTGHSGRSADIQPHPRPNNPFFTLVDLLYHSMVT